MSKVYERINFQNAPSTATPLNETNLNKMDKAIDDLDNKVVELEGYEEDAQKAIAEVREVAENAQATVNEVVTDAQETLSREIIEAQRTIDYKVADVEFYTKRDADVKYGSVIVQKATGSDILLKDSSGRPTIDFTAYGASEQKQYSGKNLLKSTASSTTMYGITFTVNDDGSITCNGKATNHAYITIASNITLPAGDYILNGCPDGGSSTTYRLHTNGKVMYDYGSGAEFTLTEETTITNLIAYISSGQTVNNLTFYPMISVEGGEFEPYVGGVASSNPSYPQEITSVGDSGYFDGELLQGAYQSSNGAFTSGANYVASKNLTLCNVNDKIVLKYKNVAPAMSVLFYDKNGNYLSNQSILNNDTLSATAPTNASSFHFYINESGVTPTNAKHICVTINKKYALIVKKQNKNFVNLNDFTAYSGGSVVVEGNKITVNGRYYAYAKIKVKPNTNYYINYNTDSSTLVDNILVYDSNISTVIFNGKGTFNTGTHTEIALLLYSGTATSGTSVYSNIQLEPNTVATDYVEHESKTTYIPIAQPLRGIGDSADSVKKDNGLYVEGRKIYKDILKQTTGTWNVPTTENSVNTTFYQCSTKLPASKSRNIICTHFSTMDFDAIWRTDKECIGISTQRGVTYIRLRVNKDRITTNLMDWLNENVVEFIYELANEICTPFADQTPFYSMKTFDGVTHISSDAEMVVEYATDTKTYIDNKFAELSAALLNN